MGRTLLFRLLGHFGLLLHGDPLVFDRWRWLKRRLPGTRNDEKLLDCGCGTGAFGIGAAKRGYDAMGISKDAAAIGRAQDRADHLVPGRARFEVQDIRDFAERAEFTETFEFVISLEVIEHLADDRAMMRHMARCLKPGGRLLLTTPYYHYMAITPDEEGPRSEVEDENLDWHVRRGYTPAMLAELCEDAGLVIEEVSYCSGVISQKLTTVLRLFTRLHYLVGWALTLPFRILPPLFDRVATPLFGWHYYSICIEAYKPRFPKE